MCRTCATPVPSLTYLPPLQMSFSFPTSPPLYPHVILWGCRPCALSGSCCVFMITTACRTQKDNVSRHCSPYSGSHRLSSPSSVTSPNPGGVTQMSCLGQGTQCHLFSALGLIVRVCIDHCSLQVEDASLVKADSSSVYRRKPVCLGGSSATFPCSNPSLVPSSHSQASTRLTEPAV